MPTLAISEEIHAEKYRSEGETYRGACSRVADALKDDEKHYYAFRDALLDGRFSPPGRVWSAIGAPRQVTAFNCFVSGTIEDSMDGIMRAVTEAAQTLRLGGGIGYDYSPLRPRNDLIATLASRASGPVSFMDIFDATCGTIAAAGHRRGAQMGTLRVDHPDILEFVRAKQGTGKLTCFNMSILATDAFMKAVKADGDFDLVFGGRRYSTVKARELWAEIMRSTWDYAEPGVLFIDTINRMNNLWYCESISATNPCGEQPLPPYGACLLGSFNLTRYLSKRGTGAWSFDYALLEGDIDPVVRAMDNVIDRTRYPLPQQEAEAKAKRRMGLGVMGAANAIEAMGHPYGSPGFVGELEKILTVIRDGCYFSSACLGQEKGSFPEFEFDDYMSAGFIRTLPDRIRDAIKHGGMRNSHLTSIAPTGTIALAADNVSSGIEPVFKHEYMRTINMPDGIRNERVQDYGFARFGVKGKTANECSVDEHLNVLLTAQKYVDSAVAKTCNVGPDVSWDSFQDVYMKAWEGGAKGCTTFREEGKLKGVLKAVEPAVCSLEDPACEACQG